MSVVTIGAVTSGAVNSTQLANPAGNNTKSAYTEISSSTSADAEAILVAVFTGGADGDVLFDVATGAASSETDIISNVYMCDNNSTSQVTRYYYFPVAIASGTRVSMRYQATNLNCDVYALIHLLDGASTISLANCAATTYGAVTADSAGTGLDPGGTANTKGSYTELEDSTTDDIDWLMVVVGGQNNTARTFATWLIDIATGAAASESIVVPDVFSQTGAADVVTPTVIGPFPVTITTGTRIAARCSCTINDATDRLIDVQVIGFDGSAAGGSGGGGFSAWIGK
jgi:hypothetical protein